MADIRFVIDLEVEGSPDPEEIVTALFKGRKSIGDFAKDVVVRQDDNVDTSKLQMKVVGGHSHEHEVGGAYCATCDDYSRSQRVLPIKG